MADVLTQGTWAPDFPGPQVYGKDVAGGTFPVADNTTRDAIPAANRVVGMSVYSVGSNLTYRLVGGIGNGNWVADGSAHKIQSPAGTTLTQRTYLVFDGTLILASDDSANDRTVVTAPGLVPKTTTLGVGAGILGGGDLSTGRSFSVDQSFTPTWTGQHSFSQPILASSIGPSSGHVHTLPAVASDTVVLVNSAQALAQKTLINPVINGAVTTTGLTMPGFALGGAVITGGGTPTGSGDLTTKAYVDASARYQTVQNNGSALTQRGILNVAPRLVATDDSGGGRTIIDLNVSGATAAAYTLPNVTVDVYGRVTSISSGTAYQTAQAAGSPLTQRATLNFLAPLTAVDDSGGSRTSVGLANAGTAGTYNSVTTDIYGRVVSGSTIAYATTAYQTVQTVGSGLTQRAILNFTSRFAANDNSGSSRTDVDLASSGVTAGTYNTVTVDIYGRATVGTNTAYLTSGTAKYQVVQNDGAPLTGRANLDVTNRLLATDDSANNRTVIDLGTTTVTPGSYTFASVTFDQYGRAEAASSGTLYYQTIQSIGSGMTQRGILDFTAPFTVTDDSGGGRTIIGFTASGAAGSYTNANITVDGFGRVTSAANGSGSFYQTLQANGVARTQRNVLNILPRLTAVDNSGNGSTDIDLPTTGVAAGSYNLGTFTVDAYGRITAASTNQATYQTVQSNGVDRLQRQKLNFSPRFTVTDDIPNSRSTIDLPTTGVTAGAYNNTVLTVNAYGQITTAATGQVYYQEMEVSGVSVPQRIVFNVLPPFTLVDDSINNRTTLSISGGGSIIGGTITTNQVAYGSAASTIQGSSNLTFDGSTMSLNGTMAFGATVGTWNQGIVAQDTTDANLIKYTPTTAGTLPWYQWAGEFANSPGHRPNEVMRFGWNIGPGGGLQNSGALFGALASEYEQYYEAPNKQMERHETFVDPTGTQTRWLSFAGSLTSPYNTVVYAYATNWIIGSGRNSNDAPSLLIGPTTTTLRSNSGNNFVLIDESVGTPAITIKSSTAGVGAQMILTSNNQLATYSNLFRVYNGAGTQLNFQGGSGGSQVFDPTSNQQTFLNVDGNGLYSYVGNTAYFQVRAGSIYNQAPYRPITDMSTSQTLGVDGGRFAWVAASLVSGSLPSAGSASFEGAMTVVPSAPGVASTLRVYMKDASNTYDWRSFSPGGGGSGMSIGGAVTGSTPGSVLFVNSGNLAQDNAKFFWDETNFRLGIGNAAPLRVLDIRGSVSTDGIVSVQNNAADGYSDILFHDNGGTLEGAHGYGNASVGLAHLQSKLFNYTTGPDWVWADSSGIAAIMKVSSRFFGIGATAPAYPLDIRNGNASTGIHLRTGTTTDTGGYIISAADSQILISGGAHFNGSNWIAKATQAELIDASAGLINFTIDGGLTVTGTFSPTRRMVIDATGAQPFVGVGSHNPTDTFDVRGTRTGTAIIRVQNLSTSGYSGTMFYDSGGTYQGEIGYANPSVSNTALQGKNYIFSNSGGPNWVFQEGNNTRITVVMASGNLNLGASTSDPGVKLNIEAATSSAGIGMGNGSSLAVSAASTGRFRYNSSTQHFEYSENGGAYAQAFGGITGTLTTGRVPYSTGSSALTDSANFTFDGTLAAVTGEGSGSLVGPLSIKSTSGGTVGAWFTLDNTPQSSGRKWSLGSGGSATTLGVGTFYVGDSTAAAYRFAIDSNGKSKFIAGGQTIETDGTIRNTVGLYQATSNSNGYITMDGTNGTRVGYGAGGVMVQVDSSVVSILGGALHFGATSTGVSSANTGRIRYNSTTQQFERSVNGGTYQPFGGVSSGNNFINIVPAGGRNTNGSATPLVVHGMAFDPSLYSLSGATGSIVFRAVAATGNTTITGHVKLRDITTGVDICTFNLTNQTTEAKFEQVLTTGTPGTNVIANSEKVYEVRIYVDSPSGLTDTIELYSAELRMINTVN